MKIAAALIVVIWWIAVWGMFDLATEDWTRTERFRLYLTLILSVFAIILIFPNVADKL